MGKKRRTLVDIQDDKVVQSRKDASRTEQSQYWDNFHNRRVNAEDVRANPDVLAETEIAAPSTPQLLMGEAITHLQGRQKEVYLLTMREGRSLAEAAEVLKIEKGTAQKYKERAIKFISQYCEDAIKRGRV